MDNNQIYYSQPPILFNKTAIPDVVKVTSTAVEESKPFNQVLANTLTGVQFSQHALQRLRERNIKLKVEELSQINNAVEKAARKGAKESLVFMNHNNLALVVSVKNKIVITAMDHTSIKDNIFTNIDSAVII